MKKLILAALLTATTLSPAHAFFRSEVKASTTVDDFDGSKIVAIKHGHIACKQSVMSCPSIGFSWSSNLPNEFIAHVKMSDTLTKQRFSIQQLQINIDGKIYSFSGIGSTDFTNTGVSIESDQGFNLPVELLDLLATSQNVKIRVVTDKGNWQGDFAGGSRESAVQKYFLKFYEELKKQNP